MNEHPYGWLSLIPPLTAIVLSILTRRVVASLLAGVASGAAIVAICAPPDGRDASPIASSITCLTSAVSSLFEEHLWKNLADADHLRVFTFTVLMGAMVNVIHQSGGMLGLVDALTPWARGRRGGQIVTWLLGLIIFFDDYANCLLLGNTLRPLTDRLKISREKLAFLVDSTAAPVSGLAIVSTWVATEISYMAGAFQDLGVEGDVFAVFIATIPYRFYVLWLLLFIPFVALLGRDFGPMLRAEREAAAGRRHDRHPAGVGAEGAGIVDRTARHWGNAVAPVTMMIFVTSALLVATGARELKADVWQVGRWFEYFSKGNSYLSLVYGSLAGLTLASLLVRVQRIADWQEIRAAAFEGARHVLPALMILWLAWCLSAVTKPEYLATGAYLGELLKGAVSPQWLPTIVFVLASAIAFATGTSWGTMGILMPIVIPVCHSLLLQQHGVADMYDPVMLGSIGGVLAGSIFGDHCSPISDTTVLSSQSSSCDHLAHVWTQLPYALLVGAVSIVFGTIPIGFGANVWWMLPVGLASLVGCLVLFGGRVEETPNES